MAQELLSDILKTISESTRLRIVLLLKDNELAVHELVEILDVGQSVVSGHLSALKKIGLAVSHRDGRRMFYTSGSLLNSGEYVDLLSEIILKAESESWYDRDQKELEQVFRKRKHDSILSFQERSDKSGRHPGESWETLAIGLSRCIRGQRIADLGCGTGRIASLLANSGNLVVGFDNDSEQIEQAKQLHSDQNSLTFELCEIEQIDVPNELFDIIIISNTLHHTAAPRRVINQAAKMLKEKGTVLIFELAAHENNFFQQHYGDYWLGFDKKVMIEWLEQSGFEDIECSTHKGESELGPIDSNLFSATRGNGAIN